MTATLDQAAADPQQTIAKLQRQLDERTAERDEALEQQTATAEVLQVINSSPGDLAPVFDAMLERGAASAASPMAACNFTMARDSAPSRRAAIRNLSSNGCGRALTQAPTIRSGDCWMERPTSISAIWRRSTIRRHEGLPNSGASEHPCSWRCARMARCLA
jgi:predicted component of type VI protein secretion system